MALKDTLSLRLASLPLILCGPIVRRVDANLVSIWVATKEKVDVKIEIFQGYRKAQDTDLSKKIAESPTPTPALSLGTNLHVTLAVLPLFDKTLIPGEVYSYNLIFEKNGSRVDDLHSLNLLKDPVLLGFQKDQFPSFIVAPDNLESLRIGHGSCRKPHGRGRDGLAALAKVIEADFTEPSRKVKPIARPHCFFHTGDQIYADDVSTFLIEYINDAAIHLLGVVEQIPLPADHKLDFDSQLKKGKALEKIWISCTTEAFPVKRRATNFYSGFSGDESNHLWAFGEFAAAYLFQWADVIWPQKLFNDLEEGVSPKIALSKSGSEEEELTVTKKTGNVETPEKRFSVAKGVFVRYLMDRAETRDYLLGLYETGDVNKKKFGGKVKDFFTGNKPFPSIGEGDVEVPTGWKTMDDLKRGPIIQSLKDTFIKNPENLNEAQKALKKFLEGTEKGQALEKIRTFFKDLPTTRRLMANMANIMSFDDHDVTDDWYLTGRWTKRALGTPLGETIIRNGLLAYAVFQASGNDPMNWTRILDPSKLAILIENTLKSHFSNLLPQSGLTKIKTDVLAVFKKTELSSEAKQQEIKDILAQEITKATLNFQAGTSDADKEKKVKSLRESILVSLMKFLPNDEHVKLLESIPEYLNTFQTDSLVSNAEPERIAEFTSKFHQALGFDDLDKPLVKFHFSFYLGTCLVLGLDTRTRRDFSGGLDAPPNLISKKALDEQIPEALPRAGTELVIVISGAPILGLATIESLGQTLVPAIVNAMNSAKRPFNPDFRRVKSKGNESVDVEHWSLNGPGFEALLDRLAQYDKVLCLAGDVHYGQTTEMDYWKKGRTKASRIVQAVSSSLKNIKPDGDLFALLPASVTQKLLSGGIGGDMTNLTTIGWKPEEARERLKLKTQFPFRQYRDADSYRDVPLRISSALGREFVFLPLRDWPLMEFDNAGEKIVDYRIVFQRDIPDPSYRWRMNVLSDLRPDSERFKSLPVHSQPLIDKDLPADINDPDYLTIQGQILQRNAFFSRSHISRTINWYCHAAIVHFAKDETGELVGKHSMYYFTTLDPPENDLPGTFEAPFTQYVFSLKQKDDSEKPAFPIELSAT